MLLVNTVEMGTFLIFSLQICQISPDIGTTPQTTMANILACQEQRAQWSAAIAIT
jgi:hypothetical protein